MNYIVIGGAGFIGSHLVKKLLAEEKDGRIVVYDNFCSGQMWHFDGFEDHPHLHIIREDVKNAAALEAALQGMDLVYHFAANPDIAKAALQPDIDFWEGSYLTNNVLEAMRKNGVKRLLYASGSGVYGDRGEACVAEDQGPMLPTSPYGASKLSCEALICSYCSMFGINASAFRFANVVGPHQTHGVGYDFIKRLLQEPATLSILGDGTQDKSYIHVDDVISALRLLEKKGPGGFSCFNVATPDTLTVSAIADMACAVLGLKDVAYRYAGGKRGWKGDVPVVRLNAERIRALGWQCGRSAREAMMAALHSMLEDARAGKFGWGPKGAS